MPKVAEILPLSHYKGQPAYSRTDLNSVILCTYFVFLVIPVKGHHSTGLSPNQLLSRCSVLQKFHALSMGSLTWATGEETV